MGHVPSINERSHRSEAAALRCLRLRGLHLARIRWVIAKAEHTDKGANPRFVVTNIAGDPQRLYDRRYCARGEMENRVIGAVVERKLSVVRLHLFSSYSLQAVFRHAARVFCPG